MPLEMEMAFDSCSVLVYSNDFVQLSNGCGPTSTTGSSLVTFTATDACGNSLTRQATVSVVDNTPPAIVTPAKDTIVECDGAGNTLALSAWLNLNGGAVAEDICSDVFWNAPILMNSIEGCGGTMEYIYMFNANDECGNTSANTIASFITQDTNQSNHKS